MSKRDDRGFAGMPSPDVPPGAKSDRCPGGVQDGARFVDSRVVRVAVSPEVAFQLIRRIGGRTGWYYANWAWRLRGWLDAMVGGPGLRPGPPRPDGPAVGDPVDFWRVEALEPNRRLRLAAEMKLPGRAWLEFEVDGTEGASRIRQTAIFVPWGLGGRVYWWGLYPIHRLVFAGMLRGIADAANRSARRP